MPQAGAVTLVLVLVCATTIIAAPAADAQTFQVIHYFTNGADGGVPQAGLTFDQAGNLYGTASNGGSNRNGTVFKMALHGSSWVFMPLYSFRGETDGGGPFARVVFGPNGSLYGTTENYNSVYNLRPPTNFSRNFLQEWDHTVLYQNQNSNDFLPANSDVVFDSHGNVYGASIVGGDPSCYPGCGFIYELTPSGGNWTEMTIYSFGGTGFEGEPEAVNFGSSGNLYGVTYASGANSQGSVFELIPSGSIWLENTLYSFSYDTGSGPQAGLIADAEGNFYGTTSAVPNGSGTVFELSPSGGGWTYTVLYTLSVSYAGGAVSALTMDAQGNLYGTIDGYCEECGGAVYKLSPGSGGWTYTELHDFTWNGSDGGHPRGSVLIGGDGTLYGTASTGGIDCEGLGCGVVWEITP